LVDKVVACDQLLVLQYDSRLDNPLKKPVTKAEFWATECDLRVPSSNCSAKPSKRGLFTVMSTSVVAAAAKEEDLARVAWHDVAVVLTRCTSEIDGLVVQDVMSPENAHAVGAAGAIKKISKAIAVSEVVGKLIFLWP
jgi:hypothetical protein